MLLTLVGLVIAAKPINAVVMIHGAGGGGWEYDKWKPVFERAGWLVIAKDLEPAAGGLSKTNFEDYLRQVVAWSGIENRGRLVLVGASMGGILALKAAEQLSPNAVILINSVPPKSVNDPFRNRKHPDIIRWANGPLKDTRDSMPDSDEQTILWAHKLWRDESGSVLNSISTGIPVKPPKCPLLVVVSEKDADVPPEVGKRIAAMYKGDVRAYPGMSHVGPLLSRSAAGVAADVLKWLDAKLFRR